MVLKKKNSKAMASMENTENTANIKNIASMEAIAINKLMFWYQA